MGDESFHIQDFNEEKRAEINDIAKLVRCLGGKTVLQLKFKAWSKYSSKIERKVSTWVLGLRTPDRNHDGFTMCPDMLTPVDCMRS